MSARNSFASVPQNFRSLNITQYPPLRFRRSLLPSPASQRYIGAFESHEHLAAHRIYVRSLDQFQSRKDLGFLRIVSWSLEIAGL